MGDKLYYKMFICPACGCSTVAETYPFAIYIAEYDKVYGLVEDLSDVGEIDKVSCWLCHNEDIAVILVPEEEYDELNDMKGKDRLMRILDLIEQGKIEIGEYEYKKLPIDNVTKLLKAIIKLTDYDDVREKAKKVLKNIAPNLIISELI